MKHYQFNILNIKNKDINICLILIYFYNIKLWLTGIASEFELKYKWSKFYVTLRKLKCKQC